MKEGLVYIIIGLMWIAIVAIVGKRRAVSNYIYLLIGITALCYGVYRFAVGVGMIVIAICLMFAIAVGSIGILVQGHKKSENENRSLSDNTIPEPSKEDEFLNKIYGTGESKRDKEGIL